LAICKLTHRQSHLNIAAVTMVLPVTALVVVIALGTVCGSFWNQRIGPVAWAPERHHPPSCQRDPHVRLG
jgi:hypothetical protein